MTMECKATLAQVRKPLLASAVQRRQSLCIYLFDLFFVHLIIKATSSIVRLINPL